MRAELCECKFMRAMLCKFIRAAFGIKNMKFKRAEHCKCEFYDS